MDSIIKITQKIDALASGAGQEEAKALQSLLSDLDDELNPQDSAGTIVKMMQSITTYLIGRIDSPHPEAVPLLKSLGNQLDTMVSMPGNSAEARKILDRAIMEFKSLKAAISQAPPVSKKEFEELKAVILSVDWEISNHTLKSFDHVISHLKERLKSNRVHFTFLRIMHSIGGYIARHGSNADKDSILLLQSVFQDYEKLVQNPHMAVAEKKSLIEGDIRKYNEFKQGISTKTETAVVSPSPQPEDELPPALSHVGSSAVPAGQATLSVLSESSKPGEGITPALAGKKGTPEEPRDVMGDLFSPKASPADELLDAIHLAELHGPSQESPAGMMPADSGSQGEGVKSYIPERDGAEPIPEIESRLDEFFNLDVSEDSISEIESADSADSFQAAEVPPPVAPVLEEDEEEEEYIQPGLSGLIKPDQGVKPAFGTDDGIETLNTLSESDDQVLDDMDQPAPPLDFATEFESSGDQELPLEMIPEEGIEFIEPEVPELDSSLLVESLEEDDPAEPVLARLKNLLITPSVLEDESIYTQALEDIAGLNQIWAADQDKRTLLEILSGLSKYVRDSANAPSLLGDDTETEAGELFAEDVLADSVEEALPDGESDGTEQEMSEFGETESAGEMLTEAENAVDDAAASLDDEFQPEEVDESTPKAKSGFWGKLTSRFRK
ncbi:MAG: hypothetical protein HUN04_25930 [Desulfobacter sp.]|nr:MAG: hypothetical protein HUN04_25930 [Desulfobacter sp.]